MISIIFTGMTFLHWGRRNRLVYYLYVDHNVERFMKQDYYIQALENHIGHCLDFHLENMPV